VKKVPCWVWAAVGALVTTLAIRPAYLRAAGDPFGAVLDLDGHAVERLRERTVCLPR
jgi:hypothetical protein